MALVSAGHEAIHTLNLPDKNQTTDRYIRQLADSEERIVVTKDADFVTSHIVLGSPLRLLQISTGNLSNTPLCPLILSNLGRIKIAFTSANFVEITATNLMCMGNYRKAAIFFIAHKT